ncbi:MAG: deoxyribodipyrimidine photo-lyase [Chlamydiales bacterium]|nr:deoxyribodipyrimidine photo-lyase [Chlamydiales bacterium]
MRKAIFWFRQDLRIKNNFALEKASKDHSIIPIYILDEEENLGGASKLWLHHSLASLNDSLKGRLLLFKGSPKTIIEALIDKHKIDACFWGRCYEPWRIKRDKALKASLKENGIETNSYNNALLWEPWEVLKDDNTPYKVFSAFYRKAQTQTPFDYTSKNSVKFPNENIKGVSLDSLKLVPKLKWTQSIVAGWTPGEKGAEKAIRQFLDQNIDDYKEGRDFPKKDATSKLSPHLHFGEVSATRVWKIASSFSASANIECFLREICWREFAYYSLFHFPQLPEKPLIEKFAAFPWQGDLKHLIKWQKGLTGYPIIDAGMRELWQTGYMHNRVRMIVASFLIKNLMIPWQKGQEWFWDCLFDADLASNSMNWQWAAGCGIDAAPYFRIFNPVTQGEKFDAQGEYTKKYVPELKNLPSKYLFQPWKAPKEVLKDADIEIGVDYPHPIIDLKLSRERALQAYHSLS